MKEKDEKGEGGEVSVQTSE